MDSKSASPWSVLSPKPNSAMDSLKSSANSAMDSFKSSANSAIDSLKSSTNSAMDSSTNSTPSWQKVVLAVVAVAIVLYASYKYLWPPLKQALDAPSVPPPSKKPSPPPKVKAEPTPNDTGFCYVGEWQGVRSCVPIKGGTCAGDLYPTADACRDPNLR